MSLQLSLFRTTALGDPQSDLFWGELEGEEGTSPVPASSVPVASLAIPQTDFRLCGTRGLADGWRQRARDNVLAIALLRELEEEDRNATAAEQVVLSRFIGFGAGDLANNLFPPGQDGFKTGWEEIGESLLATTTDAERAGLKRATQYAHFTPETIVRALWDTALRMGFRGGSVLEPGCGSGLFIAARPENLEGRIAFTGIENDPITARIARKLYPNQWIRSEDFTTAKLAAGYDLAIGNPPFSNRTVRGPEGLTRLGLSLHDYFIARSVEALRPGGVAMFVTSRYTLDKTDSTARRTIAEMADLVGAVRLPAGTMRNDAGTDVVIDVLVFRKRGIGDLPGDENWLETGEVPGSNQGNGPLVISRYFLDRPEQVAGRHGWTTTQFGSDYTCEAADGLAPDAVLPTALARIGQDVRFPAPAEQRIVRPAGSDVLVGTAADGALLKEGSYFVTRGVLQQIADGQAVTVPIRKGEQKEGIFQKHARIISALVPIRDAARAVLRAQMENLPYGRLQGELKRAYLSFVRQYGPINLTNVTVRVDPETGVENETQRRPNLTPFYDDPDVWLVSSIEEYDEATQKGRMGPIFSERVIHAPVEPEIHSAHDALAVCLHETGGVEMPRIAELLGQPEGDVVAALGEAVYLDPERSTDGRDVWVTSDEMLSGAVRTKLEQARDAARADPRYARNVTALEALQPADLRPSEITARLGAPWLPVSDIVAFTAEC